MTKPNLPSWYHAKAHPHITGPGVCVRCGLFYQAELKFQKKDPDLELCGHCKAFAGPEIEAVATP